jgi:hypothetical protein
MSSKISEVSILQQLSLEHVMAYLSLQDENLALVPDLYSLMGKKFLKLLKMHGGQQVYLPTIDELRDALFEIDIITAKVRNDMSWAQVKNKLDVTDAELVVVRNKYNKFCSGARKALRKIME